MASVGEENKKIRDAKEEKVQAAVDAVLRTEPGRVVFKEIFEMSGYNRDGVIANRQTAEISLINTTYNAIRRGFYVRLRKLASPELIRVVEEAADLEQREIPQKKNEKKNEKEGETQ